MLYRSQFLSSIAFLGWLLLGSCFLANADDGLIDSDQFPSEPFAEEFKPPTMLEQRTLGRNLNAQQVLPWSFGIAGVAMSRSDRLRLTWLDFIGTRTSVIESDVNAGLRFDALHRSARDSYSPGKITRFSLLSITGDGSTQVGHFGDRFDNHASLLSAWVGMGETSPLLLGEFESTLGLRYLSMKDSYDFKNPGFNPHVDVIKADNQQVTLQGRFGGLWHWKRIDFSAALAGGLGGNYASQSQNASLFSYTEFDQSEYTFSVLSELTLDLQWAITTHLQLRTGLQGLLLTDMATSRNAFEGPGDLDFIRYLGGTFGLDYRF